MIESLAIRNFQSLHHVDLDLSPYTVIVGKSSSGKSALVRAIKTLTSNRRGLDFLTHGQTVCTITATTEQGSVTLTRGKATGDNHYTLTPTGQDQQTFTKLGAAVPEEVSTFLGIESVEPINYAGQHDYPFMLKDSGPAVAQKLGRLTNVDVIFSAARESNRQKLEASKNLSIRVSDLDGIKDRAKGYAGLKAQHEALAAAEEALGQAYALSRDIERIKSTWENYSVATGALVRLQELAGVPVPSLEAVKAAEARLEAFEAMQRQLVHALGDLKSAKSTKDELQGQVETEQEAYRAKLSTLGHSIAEFMSEKSSSTHQSPSGAALIELGEAGQLSADYIVDVLS